jgi:hypothetical protein
MFKNINKIFIWIVGLIICYVFYNVFILENFTSSLNTLINSKRQAIRTAKKDPTKTTADITKLENELHDLEIKSYTQKIDRAKKDPTKQLLI